MGYRIRKIDNSLKYAAYRYYSSPYIALSFNGHRELFYKAENTLEIHIHEELISASDEILGFMQLIPDIPAIYSIITEPFNLLAFKRFIEYSFKTLG